MSFVIVNCTAETFTPTRSGAICTFIWEICNCAQREGIQPWVITKTSPAAPYAWPKTIFLKYPWVPKNKVLSKLFYIQRDITGWGHVRQLAYNKRVAKAIRKKKLDKLPILLSNDIELAVYLREQFPNAKIVHHAHNDNTCSEKFRKQFKDSINAATAVSSSCAHWNRGYFGLDEVHPILSGVDTERFHPAKDDPPGPPVINFVGRTDHSKGTDLLLLAAKKLAEKTKDFRLQILGSNHYGYSVPDDFQAMIEELSRDLEKSGISVNRPGFVDRHKLPDELRKAHINVVPSRWQEPFGLVTTEGMASGLATIVASVGGLPEIIRDDGMLFERGNVDQLASQLERLVCDPDTLRDYRNRARKRAKELTWQRTWETMRAVLGV